MKVNNINRLLFFVVFFLTFLGYYFILLAVFTQGLSDLSRLITVPIRILIIAAYFLLLFLNFRSVKVIWQTKIFLVFSLFYICRIAADYLSNTAYYISTTDLLFYFFSFAVVPYFTISSIKINADVLRAILNSFLVSSLAFSVLSVVVYSRFIGTVARLTAGSTSEQIISPLALSYCSTLAIGISIFYIIYNKTTFFVKILGIIVIICSVVPFFLGASRGSIVALFVPFFVLLLKSKNAKFVIQSFLILIVSIISLAYLDSFLSSGLLDRFLNINKDIDSANSSAVRTSIWEKALNQFMDHPLLGDKLRVDFWGAYAHNIFIESLQTMGIFGFILIAILFVSAWKKAVYIIGSKRQYAWISVIFMQAFFQNMFSGNLATASWLWASTGLLFAMDRYFKSKELNNSN